MIKYSGNTINDWWRSSSAITKMMYNGNQAYRRKVRVLPTRWVVDDTSYLCVSYDKYEKEVKEYSLDDGITWTKYIPEISRPGDLIFSGSVDCGAAPQERWAVDASSYICEGYDKYEKEVKQYCLDDYGINWANYVPEISRKGNLIKQNARQCGYTADTQEPCYDVAASVTAFTGEFEDAFETTSGKWYKKNNLNQYEQYGVYGTSTGGTYYDGKLVVENGYEYKYSGNTWVNLGEITGSTATLPDIPFVLNYNAKNYDSITHTIPMAAGQLNGTDAVAVVNPSSIIDHSDDGYISVSESSMSTRIEGQDINLFNRMNGYGTSEMTIISKALTRGGFSVITNREEGFNFAYNWMYRQYYDHLTLHGNMETGQISCSYSEPNILSVRTYWDDNNNGTYVYYNNWTTSAETAPVQFQYGSITNAGSKAGALFVGYNWDMLSEQWTGDFYWVYMTQNTLTDAQIQQVIYYNEEGAFPVYPEYYDVMLDPPNNVVFTSMTQAEDYECPWVGMKAIINGSAYTFNTNYEWEEVQAYWNVSTTEWQTSTDYGDLPSTGYTFYESFSNYHQTNSTATTYITIFGYESFSFKIRSYGESCCDYVEVYDIDSDYTIKLSDSNNSQEYQWTDVTFTGISPNVEHTIKVIYKKDGSVNGGSDRGYIAIPNNQ